MCPSLALLYYLLLKCLKYFSIAVGTLIVWGKLYHWKYHKNCTCKTRLDGKVVLVTGGNSGIGLETARDLARRGARVVIASRNESRSQAAVADIVATTGNEKVEHRHLDLASFDSVRKFASQFNAEYERLDILVNNSGCGGLGNQRTEEGLNVVMQINHFGPFLLTNLLLKKLIESKPSRIIIVSSLLHFTTSLDIEDLGRYLDTLRTYGNSKLCNILWAKALSKKLPEGVTVNALHPGLVKTNVFNNLHPVTRSIALYICDYLFKTAVEGAQTSVHLAVSEQLKDKSGEYYSDCVKGWKSWAANDDALAEAVLEKSYLLTKSEKVCF